MKNSTPLLLLLILLFLSCQKDDSFEVTSTNKLTQENNTAKTGFVHVDEETNCNGYNSIFPSGDGITGSFTINTTIDLYEVEPYGCNYIRFTGKYNKQTKTLSEIKAHYNSDYVLLGEVRYKYSIAKTDITWYPRVEDNTFRLLFNIDKIYERGGDPGVNDSHYPDTGSNTDSSSTDSNTSGTSTSGQYGVYSVISDGKYIDFVAE